MEISEKISKLQKGDNIIKFDNKLYFTKKYLNDKIKFIEYFYYKIAGDEIVHTYKYSGVGTTLFFIIDFQKMKYIDYRLDNDKLQTEIFNEFINTFDFIKENEVNEIFLDCLKQKQINSLIKTNYSKEEIEKREKTHQSNLRKALFSVIASIGNEIYKIADKNNTELILNFNSINSIFLTEHGKFPILNPNSDGKSRDESNYLYYIFSKEFNIILEDEYISTTIEIIRLLQLYYPILKFAYIETDDKSGLPNIKVSYETENIIL